MSMLEVDKKTFGPEVLEAEGKVLVDFYGDGCVPCAALMPHVHELAEKYEGQLKFCALNTTKARRVAIGQQVVGLPTVAIFENGQKIEEVCKDDATAESVEEMIKRNI